VLPRDERSAHLLAQIDISSTPISDIVFLSQKVRQPKTPITIRRVGISLRSGFTRDDTLLQAIIEFLHTRGYQLVFLAHSLHHHPSRDDRKVLDELDKTLHIEVTHTLKETLDAYAHLDVVVGMRFHSIVLAALHALPTIILSYGPKTLSLAEELHLTEVTLRAQEIDIEDFAKKWHYLEQNSTDLSRSISSRATTIQKKLLQQLQSHDILPL
jgi:polysaccharide pyruvyl transferase WcaK-like protein